MIVGTSESDIAAPLEDQAGGVEIEGPREIQPLQPVQIGSVHGHPSHVVSGVDANTPTKNTLFPKSDPEETSYPGGRSFDPNSTYAWSAVQNAATS